MLSGAGKVLMGIGSGQGDNLVEAAADSATQSPLLSRGIEGASHLLINITGSEELSLFDANEIVERISAATQSDDVNVFFGVTYDNNIGDEVRVTLIATGFDHSEKVKILRPSQIKADRSRQYDPSNYDIPAFLRYSTE